MTVDVLAFGPHPDDVELAMARISQDRSQRSGIPGGESAGADVPAAALPAETEATLAGVRALGAWFSRQPARR